MKNIPFFVLIFSSSALFGQQLSVDRKVEFRMSSYETDNIQMVSLGKEGTVLIEFLENDNQLIKRLRTTRFDSTLTQSWQSNLQTDAKFYFLKSFLTTENLFIVYQKLNEPYVSIVNTDLSDGSQTITDLKMLTRMDIEYVAVLGSKALFGGKYNDRAVIEMHNLLDKSSKILPGMYANNTKLIGIDINKIDNTIYAMLKDSKGCQFSIHTFDVEGKNTSKTLLGNKQHVIMNGKVLKNDKNEFFLIGAYSDNCTDFSVGFYVYPIEKNQPSETKFFDFASFKNYLNYLPEKRKERVEERLENKKEKGKEIKLRYRLLLHEIQASEKGWNLVAEVYYPEYNSQLSGNYGWNYSLQRVGNSYYNQFKYSHAIICEFDATSNMAWDASINLNYLTSRELNEVVQVSKHPEGMVIAYPEKDWINTSLVKYNGEKSLVERHDVRSDHQEKGQVELLSSNLLAWYGNHFLVYGFEQKRITPTTEPQTFLFLKSLSYGQNP